MYLYWVNWNFINKINSFIILKRNLVHAACTLKNVFKAGTCWILLFDYLNSLLYIYLLYIYYKHITSCTICFIISSVHFFFLENIDTSLLVHNKIKLNMLWSNLNYYPFWLTKLFRILSNYKVTYYPKFS